MTGFLLSPGITPALVGLFSLELPLALSLGYLLDERRGFAIALALSALLLGGIKVYTDPADPYDVTVASLALLAAAAVLAEAAGISPRSTRVLGMFLGLLAIPYGLTKIGSDFYDPFDIFVADTAIALGGLLLWEEVRSLRALPSFQRRAWGYGGGDLALLTIAIWENGLHAWIAWPLFLLLAGMGEAMVLGAWTVARRKAEAALKGGPGSRGTPAQKD